MARVVDVPRRRFPTGRTTREFSALTRRPLRWQFSVGTIPPGDEPGPPANVTARVERLVGGSWRVVSTFVARIASSSVAVIPGNPGPCRLVIDVEQADDVSGWVEAD